MLFRVGKCFRAKCFTESSPLSCETAEKQTREFGVSQLRNENIVGHGMKSPARRLTRASRTRVISTGQGCLSGPDLEREYGGSGQNERQDITVYALKSNCVNTTEALACTWGVQPPAPPGWMVHLMLPGRQPAPHVTTQNPARLSQSRGEDDPTQGCREREACEAAARKHGDHFRCRLICTRVGGVDSKIPVISTSDCAHKPRHRR